MAKKKGSKKKTGQRALAVSEKADVVVFWGADGKPYVRPGVVIVEKKNHRAPLMIRNYTECVATIVVPHASNPKTLTLDGKGKAGCKRPLDLGDFDADAYPYHVYVGTEEAEGNSSPMVIIDE